MRKQYCLYCGLPTTASCKECYTPICNRHSKNGLCLDCHDTRQESIKKTANMDNNYDGEPNTDTPR
jgi:hypothetical protein